MKIRLKLTLGFLAIAALVAVVGYFASASSQKMLEDSIGDQTIAMAEDLLRDIERRIYSRIETLQEERKNPYIQQALSVSNRAFETMGDAQGWILENDRHWTTAPKEEVTPFMQELIDNELSRYLRSNMEFYEEKYGYKVFAEIFVTNKYGANIGQTGKTTDYNQADETWWRKAKEDGLYIVDVAYDDSSGVYCIEIVLRLDDSKGDFLGVLTAVLNIVEIDDFLEKAKMTEEQYKTIQFTLLTRHGEVIYSTDKNQPLSAERTVITANHMPNNHGSHHILKVQTDTGPAGNGEILFSHVHSKGYRDFRGLGWMLTARIDTREVFEHVNQFRTHILVVSMTIAVLAVILGLFISKTIANPIQKLTAAVSRVNGDNLNIALDEKSSDEVGQLAEAFNKMIGDLRVTTSSVDDLNREIDERKKAEEKLLKLLSLHDATLEATADGILVIGLDGHVVTHNQKFLEMWHIPAEMAANRDNEKLLAYVCDQLKDPGAFLAESRRFYSHPQDNAFDILEFQDGRVFERFSKPQMINGKIVGYVRSFRDISDRKKAEDELKKTCTQLEKANRDLVDMQAQAVQSEKMASIGQLAAGVAHEINNPIGFVSSNFETLENYGAVFLKLISTYDELVREIQNSAHADWAAKGEAIEKVRNELKIDFIIDDIHSLFEDSREGLDRITKIIQSLRDFSRIDQVGDFCEYDLNEGLKTTLVVARNEIKYDCEIQTEFAEIPPVFCNPGQINQVILNILVNAAQAIKSQNRSENGSIAIKTYKTDKHVICQIIDDGPGIPPEIITKVFDPFFTTKPVGKGTGLGLSISRDIIVNKHKGELLVDSTVGKGTTFTIKLPLHSTLLEPSESNEESIEEESMGKFT